MKGVILAAGKGTRLYPATRIIPKPLLPMANRTTLEYAFDRLKEIGIHDICLVVGDNEDQMRAALGDGRTFGVDLTFVRQHEPRGLAHAVGFAKEFIGSDSFAMYLGDAIYEEGFAQHAKRFEESGCANLNIVKAVPDPSRFGVANVDGERIVKLEEKPKVPKGNLAMAGMYFFGPQLWSVLPDLKPSERGEYEITDAIQLMIDRGETVLAGIYEAVWFDTGTLDSYLETTRFLVNGGSLIAPDARHTGNVGSNVVIGGESVLECASIEDSVVLPGANVKVRGKICHAILGGPVSSDGDIVSEIRHGDYRGA